MTRLLAVLTASLVGGTGRRSRHRRPRGDAATGTFSQPTPTEIAPHRSLISHDATITIPSSGPASSYPAPIQVSGLTGTITDVDVRLNTLNHPFPSDLDVMLVGPGGQHVVLMSDAGANVPVVDTTFFIDDEAPSPLPGPGQINTDRYQPTNYGAGDPFPAPAPSASDAATELSAFDGTNPNGVWSLYVVDDTLMDSGSLKDGWSLSIDTLGDRPAVSLDPAGLRCAGQRHRRRPGARPACECRHSRTWTCCWSARPGSGQSS